MDVTVLDQLTAWAGRIFPQYPRWLTSDLGRYLVGAGSVYLIANVILPRTTASRINTSEIPGNRQMANRVQNTAPAVDPSPQILALPQT